MERFRKPQETDKPLQLAQRKGHVPVLACEQSFLPFSNSKELRPFFSRHLEKFRGAFSYFGGEAFVMALVRERRACSCSLDFLVMVESAPFLPRVNHRFF